MFFFFFFQAEDGIRDLVRSRGLGDVYKRQRQPQREGHVVRHPVAELEARGLLEVELADIVLDLSLIHI